KVAIGAIKSIIARGIYMVMSIVGGFLWLGGLGEKYPPLTPATFHPTRILVIRLDLIGDLVLSLTVVRAVNRTSPEAKIDLLALLSGARRRVGYGPEGVPSFMTDSVPGGIPGRWRHWAPLDNKHEVDYCLELARAAGATLTPADRIPRLYVDERTHLEVKQLLRQEGVESTLPGKPLIICHINSNNGQSKRWPIPYWATLIDRLMRQAGAHVVLTGAAADLPQIEAVTKRMREHAINLAGKTNLTQLTALLQKADLLISGDSGPLHMGVACGTPIIGIYGPTNPLLGGPASPDATVLRSGIWCSPCYNAKEPADCPFYTTQCMKNITPTRVFEIAHDKLMSNQKLKNY